MTIVLTPGTRSSVVNPRPLAEMVTPERNATATNPSVGVAALPTGPPGPPGPAGPPGPSGGAYIHRQTEPSATWTVEHNLGTKPQLVLIADDDPGQPTYTDITYVDDNTAVVEWPSPVTGEAHAR